MLTRQELYHLSYDPQAKTKIDAPDFTTDFTIVLWNKKPNLCFK
jgi:hypothetical protein